MHSGLKKKNNNSDFYIENENNNQAHDEPVSQLDGAHQGG